MTQISSPGVFPRDPIISSHCHHIMTVPHSRSCSFRTSSTSEPEKSIVTYMSERCTYLVGGLRETDRRCSARNVVEEGPSQTGTENRGVSPHNLVDSLWNCHSKWEFYKRTLQQKKKKMSTRGVESLDALKNISSVNKCFWRFEERENHQVQGTSPCHTPYHTIIP